MPSIPTDCPTETTAESPHLDGPQESDTASDCRHQSASDKYGHWVGPSTRQGGTAHKSEKCVRNGQSRCRGQSHCTNSELVTWLSITALEKSTPFPPTWSKVQPVTCTEDESTTSNAAPRCLKVFFFSSNCFGQMSKKKVSKAKSKKKTIVTASK